MNHIKPLILVIAIFMLSAWNWPTHEEFAGKIYDSFSGDVKLNLNKTIVKEGSIVPDKVFMDYGNHSYPGSVIESKLWLERSVEAYKSKDYGAASMALGISMHYISDSFAAPHNIQGEEYYLHKEFEDAAEGVPFDARCSKGKKDPEKYLAKANFSEKEWNMWLITKDRNVQSKELRRALESAYSLSHAYYEKECSISIKDRFLGFMRILIFRFS